MSRMPTPSAFPITITHADDACGSIARVVCGECGVAFCPDCQAHRDMGGICDGCNEALTKAAEQRAAKRAKALVSP